MALEPGGSVALLRLDASIKKWVGPVAPPVAAVRKIAMDTRESLMMILCFFFNLSPITFTTPVAEAMRHASSPPMTKWSSGRRKGHRLRRQEQAR